MSKYKVLKYSYLIYSNNLIGIFPMPAFTRLKSVFTEVDIQPDFDRLQM